MKPPGPLALLQDPRLARKVFRLAIVLLSTAVVADLSDLATGTGAWALAAYWLTAAGISAGGVAGLCALWRVLPHAPRGSLWALTGRPGFFKGVAIALFALSWSLRVPEADIPRAALVVALLGIGFATAAPWLPGGAQQPPAAPDSDDADAASQRHFEDSSRPAEVPPASAL